MLRVENLRFEKVSYEQFKKDFIECNCIPLKMCIRTDKHEVILTEIYSEEELDNIIRNIYNNIKLPKRATSGSAGYDFYSPISFTLTKSHVTEPDQAYGCNTSPYAKKEDLLKTSSITIPTGIRCKMPEGLVLKMYPRSGQGFKTGARLANTVGIIDSDYYYSDNEGHIMLKLISHNMQDLEVKAGQGVAQGLFLQYFITENDNTTETRNGGFGSTTK